jgi:hypothetical protein
VKKFTFASLAALLLVASSLTRLRADDSVNGTWALLSQAGETRLEISWSNGRSSTQSTLRPVDANALGIASALASSGGHVRFGLHREAGDYYLEGWVARGKGGGTFIFTPNAAFFDDMRSRGYRVTGPENELAAADLDITREYINELQHAGMSLDFDQLIAFRALRIDGAYIEAMASVGFTHLDANQLESMKALHIDRAYIEGIRAQGVTGVDEQSVVELKALHADASYVQELGAAGYPHLSAQDYVQLKALHIDGEYVKDLARHGLTHLTVQQLVNYKALGIR